MGEGQNLGIYEASFQKAAELLRKSDLEYNCAVCGAELGGNRIVLRFFGENYSILLPDVVFEPSTIPVYEQVLLLHYLTTLERHETSGSRVSFKNLPGASFYEAAYRRRGPERILRIFGNDLDGFVRAAERLGGSREGYGDASVKLTILPRIEAVVVLFRGDEEFNPEANILYRDDIVNFLPLEDIAVLSGLIASRLKRAVA